MDQRPNMHSMTHSEVIKKIIQNPVIYLDIVVFSSEPEWGIMAANLFLYRINPQIWNSSVQSEEV